jgi:hypothetical protein
MPRRRATQLAIDGLAKPRPAPFRLPPQPEKAFMAAVLQYAGLMGWRHFHDVATNAPRACWNCGRQSAAPRNTAGWPDLVLLRRPRVLFVELKREGEHPTTEQIAWLDDLRACGQDVRLWRPGDWPEIEKVLR